MCYRLAMESLRKGSTWIRSANDPPRFWSQLFYVVKPLRDRDHCSHEMNRHTFIG